MNELKSVLNRIINDLDFWCITYHPKMYTDPTKSLKLIADRARSTLNKFQENETDCKYPVTKLDDKTILIDGVKYQKVEEHKSFYNKLWELVSSKVGDNTDADELTDRIMDLIKDNIPEPIENTNIFEVIEGYNNALKVVRERFFMNYNNNFGG